MAEMWPWRGNSLSPVELLKWNPPTQKRKKDRTGGWIPSMLVIGEECLWWVGRDFTDEVGNTLCKRYLVTNGTTTWWIPKELELYWARKKGEGKRCIKNNMEGLYQCYKPGIDLYSEIPEISKFWRDIDNKQERYWEPPDGLFWICHRKAYPILPSHWAGSCTLGTIQPGFFLLPEQEGD